MQHADPCIYVRNENSLSIVAVYVYDLIIATKAAEDMQELKQWLQNHDSKWKGNSTTA